MVNKKDIFNLNNIAVQLNQVVQMARETIRKANGIGSNADRWKGILECLDFAVAIFRGATDLKERFKVSFLISTHSKYF